MARPRSRPGNLPAEATSFIGRRLELSEIRTKLARARLISLVGPGGVGKTRLAVRAATELCRSFRDGAWIADLAEVRDATMVSNRVMVALDLRDQAPGGPLALVLRYLVDRELLLLIDNCEHVVGEAARLVNEALGSSPRVRIIATSREPLSVAGEHVLPVPPLELPPAGSAEPIELLRQNEAVLLFTQRAAQASGRFELTPSNRAPVVELCRRLDGLPLAIELAAVRSRVLTAEQILDRLDDRFSLLTGGSRAAPPRQQTLQTTIDWSHDLLQAAEQALLRRLSVFAGRFTLEDVEAVCTSIDQPSPDPLVSLTSLVEKSLVIMQEGGRLASYRLHESMREYAGRKLEEAGETSALQLRYADYYAARCRRSTAQARFRLPEWLDWIEVEIENVRAVLRLLLDRNDFERAIDLATSVGWYWTTRATAEGVWWLDRLLRVGRPYTVTYARALFVRGFLAVLQADAVAALPPLEQSATAAGEAGEPRVRAQALSMASIAAGMAGDHQSARTTLGRARVASATVDDVPTRLMLLQAEAYNGLFAGDLESVRRAASEGVRLSRELGDLFVLQNMLLNLGTASLAARDVDEARVPLDQALRIARQLDDRYVLHCTLDALGCHAARSGRHHRAAQLLGAAETVRTSTGASPVPFLAALAREARDSAVSALGPSKFENQLGAGKRLSRDEAVGVALGEPTSAAAASSQGDGADVLGRREVEVARLVGEGLTNKQIASRLFISDHTVDSHVRSIMNKLGVNSRAQIAAWISSTRDRSGVTGHRSM